MLKPVRPIFSLTEERKVDSAVGTGVLALYKGIFLKITAAHVIKDCPHGIAFPSAKHKTIPPQTINHYVTGDEKYVEADLAVNVIGMQNIMQFADSEYVDLENHIFPDEYPSKKVLHTVLGHPAELQNYPDSYPYIEEELTDIRQSLHGISKLDKKRLKEYIAIHFPKAKFNREGMPIKSLEGCSGGAVYTRRINSKVPRFSGIILHDKPYKKQDVMIIGVGMRVVMNVVRKAISKHLQR